MPTIFLTHPPEFLKNYYGERALAGLRALGDVRLNSTTRELNTAELIEAARGAQVIVSHRHVPGDPELFASLPDLVAFCRCAVDIRNVNVAAATGHGILVTQASAGFIASTSEWVVGAMLDLSRGFSASVKAYHASTLPEAVMGRQLKGSVLGVIGYGQIGRYLCDLGLALGMHVLVTDPYATVPSPRIRQLELLSLLQESDFVVCVALATNETENLMNSQAFALMKPDAFFINASRGNLVDEVALLQALDSGHIAGCAMDVGRAPDQKPSLKLARHPKVIATPHIGGLTPPAIEHQALETVSQVAEIVQGRVPAGAVNAASATRLGRLLRA
jgi:D-3-phosphoglycerate dehydrogenase